MNTEQPSNNNKDTEHMVVEEHKVYVPYSDILYLSVTTVHYIGIKKSENQKMGNSL